MDWTYLERDECFFSLSPSGGILALVQLLAQGFKSDHLLRRKDIFDVAFTFLGFKALIPRKTSVGDGLPIASQCHELDKGTKN